MHCLVTIPLHLVMRGATMAWRCCEAIEACEGLEQGREELVGRYLTFATSFFP